MWFYPAVHIFSTELPCSSHVFHVYWFCVDVREKIYIDSTDYGE